MKKTFCFLLFVTILILLNVAADFPPATRSPRNIQIGKMVHHTLTLGNFEIVHCDGLGWEPRMDYVCDAPHLKRKLCQLTIAEEEIKICRKIIRL